jgi:hypothetical protein
MSFGKAEGWGHSEWALDEDGSRTRGRHGIHNFFPQVENRWFRMGCNELKQIIF